MVIRKKCLLTNAYEIIILAHSADVRGFSYGMLSDNEFNEDVQKYLGFLIKHQNIEDYFARIYDGWHTAKLVRTISDTHCEINLPYIDQVPAGTVDCVKIFRYDEDHNPRPLTIDITKKDLAGTGLSRLYKFDV